MRKFVPFLIIVATGCRNDCGFWWGDERDCGTTTAGVRELPGTEADTDTDADSDSDTDPQTDGLATTGTTGDTGLVETHSGTTVGHSGSTASTADTGTETDADTDADSDTDVPAETADTGVIVDTDTDTDVPSESADTGLVGPTPCGPSEFRFSGSYTSPGGVVITAVKIQIYNAAGSEIRRMLTIVDGVDGWSVDSSAQSVVTFSNESCYPSDYTFYASALYNGQPGYDCSGNANPNYVSYGTWTFGFDDVAGAVAYVNNYEINGAFPFGYGGGCEAKAIR